MKAIILATTALGIAATPALATNPQATAFGAREFVQQISLSPDGKSLAIIEPAGTRGSALYIAKLDSDTPQKPILSGDGGAQQLEDCHWSTDTRLVCSVYIIAGTRSNARDFVRLVSVGSDGSNLKLLSERTTSRSLGVAANGGEVIDWLADDKGGSMLIQQAYVPEDSTGTHMADTRQGFGVERIDTTSLATHTVVPPNREAVDFITDGHGTVRVRALVPRESGGYDSNVTKYFYRKTGDDAWLPLSTTEEHDGKITGFTPTAVDRDLNVVYGYDDHDGRTAVYKIALDGSLKKELVYARPDVDVDGLVQIGRQRRVVGVSYVTDKRHTDFFDPQLKALRDAFAKALPNDPLVTFVDASADENTLLLFAGSDVDPGQYYVFDKRTKHLSPLLPVRPALANVALAPVKPITFAAADGTPIPAYLTLPPGSTGKHLPAIVMPHGGPGARDEWGFDWLAQYFANRGFVVLQPNFRGSTGYGESWFVDNGFKSWRTAIGDVDDGGRWLIKQGIADPAKLAIVGWSYGGYAALQSGVADPDLFKAIVAIAPVTDLGMLKEEAYDFVDYHNVVDFIGDGPDLAEASPARNADRIKAPVLLFHGDLDRNVGIGESELMEKRLKAAGKTVSLVEFKGLDHQLDDSAARAEMLDKADAFLRTSMGM